MSTRHRSSPSSSFSSSSLVAIPDISPDISHDSLGYDGGIESDSGRSMIATPPPPPPPPPPPLSLYPAYPAYSAYPAYQKCQNSSHSARPSAPPIPPNVTGRVYLATEDLSTIPRHLQSSLNRQHPRVGSVCVVVKRSDDVNRNRHAVSNNEPPTFMYYLIAKRREGDRIHLKDMNHCLAELRCICHKHDVTRLDIRHLIEQCKDERLHVGTVKDSFFHVVGKKDIYIFTGNRRG